MIDLHGHYLPGLDDGPADLATAVAMCRLAAAGGCDTVVVTPHLRRDEWPEVTPGRIREATAALQAAVGPAPRLLPGAEIRVDSDLLADLAAPGRVLPLGDSPALLLELDPWGLGPDPVALVHELRHAGWIPVIAHPEHIPFLAGDPELVAHLVAAGARLQITAASLLGEAGRGAREHARALVDEGLAALVASDAHGVDWRPPGLARARAEVARQWGEARATELFETAPAALFAGAPQARGAGETA